MNEINYHILPAESAHSSGRFIDPFHCRRFDDVTLPKQRSIAIHHSLSFSDHPTVPNVHLSLAKKRPIHCPSGASLWKALRLALRATERFSYASETASHSSKNIGLS